VASFDEVFQAVGIGCDGDGIKENFGRLSCRSKFGDRNLCGPLWERSANRGPYGVQTHDPCRDLQSNRNSPFGASRQEYPETTVEQGPHGAELVEFKSTTAAVAFSLEKLPWRRYRGIDFVTRRRSS
jgi:hypothetical protein